MRALASWVLALLAFAWAPAARADCGYENLANGTANPDEWEAIVRCRQVDAAHAAGLRDLARTELPAGHTEIRIRFSAYAHGFDPMLRLRRYPRGSVVGALHYEYPLENFDSPDNRDFRRHLRQVCIAAGRGEEMGSCRQSFRHLPRWREIFERLAKLDIETIPDQSDLPRCRPPKTAFM